MKTLGYPLAMTDRIPEITDARNIELGLGLQVFRLGPYKLSAFYEALNLPIYCKKTNRDEGA